MNQREFEMWVRYTLYKEEPLKHPWRFYFGLQLSIILIFLLTKYG